MDDDLKNLLLELYKTLEGQQKAIGQLQLLGTSLLGTLRESNPNFEARYAKQFEAVRKSPIGQDSVKSLWLIAEIIKRLEGM